MTFTDPETTKAAWSETGGLDGKPRKTAYICALSPKAQGRSMTPDWRATEQRKYTTAFMTRDEFTRRALIVNENLT